MTKKPKNKGGRPRNEITPEQFAKLIAALQHGFKLHQAWSEAKITKDQYYRRRDRDSKFCEEIDEAIEHPSKLARKTVVASIAKGDVRASEWWLSHHRNDREDFKESIKVDGIPKNDNRMFIIANGRKLPWLDPKVANEEQQEKDAKKKIK